MARSRTKFPRKAAMQGRPMQIPPVKIETCDKGRAMITVMLDSPRWVRFIGGKPKVQRSFGLDRFGMQVYEACDGKTSVRRIVKRFAAANRLAAAEAELAVSRFLKTLMAKGLIAMEVSKDSVGKGRN